MLENPRGGQSDDLQTPSTKTPKRAGFGSPILIEIDAILAALNGGRPRKQRDMLAHSLRNEFLIERKAGRRAYKMSAAHRRAIAEGIRKSELRKAGAKDTPAQLAVGSGIG